MANKETAKAEENPDAAPPPKRGKKLIIIAASAVLVIILLIAGAFFLGQKVGKSATTNGEASAAQSDQDSKKDEVKEADKKPPVFVALEPFTVNLQTDGNNGEQFLQMVVTLRVSDEKKGEELKALTPQIRNEILNLAGGKKASDIITPNGREDLADDIKDAINEVMGYDSSKRARRKKDDAPDASADVAPVMDVFFTQFIVQ